MHIVIAPDSYKESLSALEVACAIEAGFKEIFPNARYSKIPVADGGEGTVQAIIDATAGRIVTVTVSSPLGKPVNAFYGLSGDGTIAIIEMAAASGLALVPSNQRDPRITTSYGTGELIRHALDSGARHFIIGIGGSATNDGGMGMLQALGIRFLDKAGNTLANGGASLIHLARIDKEKLDPRIQECVISVACDVDNPLIGPKGASAIFGPQKGATAQMVTELDQALAHYAAVVARDFGINISDTPGAGAAGGMGAAMLGFLQGVLRLGSEIVTEVVKLADYIQTADYVITGEGRIDGQTIFGKTPMGVAKIAKNYNKPVIGIAGCLTLDAAVVYDHGIDVIFSVLHRACTTEEAYTEAVSNIRMTARNIAALLNLKH